MNGHSVVHIANGKREIIPIMISRLLSCLLLEIVRIITQMCVFCCCSLIAWLFLQDLKIKQNVDFVCTGNAFFFLQMRACNITKTKNNKQNVRIYLRSTRVKKIVLANNIPSSFTIEK